jgi:hypothetical protein
MVFLNTGYLYLTMAHALKFAHNIKTKVKTDSRVTEALAALLRVSHILEGFVYPGTLTYLKMSEVE